MSTLDTIDQETAITTLANGDEMGAFQASSGRTKKVTMATLANFVPQAKFSTAALSVGTLAAGSITGAAFVVLQNTGATPGAQTTRTAAQMLADMPGAQVGSSYMFRIANTGAGTLTLTMDASVTGTGTLTVATNVWRDYNLTFNTATTATIQSVGAGTSP